MSQKTVPVERFKVMIASDLDHDRVYAEIYCDDRFVALVSQEQGLESAVLEIPGPGLAEEQICRQVDLDAFIEAVNLARSRLAE